MYSETGVIEGQILGKHLMGNKIFNLTYLNFEAESQRIQTGSQMSFGRSDVPYGFEFTRVVLH